MRGQDRISLLALCRIPGVKWELIAREAARPGGLERLLSGDVGERGGADARKALREGLGAIGAHRETVAKMIEQVEAAGDHLTTVLDDDYPLNLRMIFNSPPFLFYRGELLAEPDALSVAVVGTRNATDEGLRRAEKMARLLATNGVTVLSGLAKGIDTAAHQATLRAGGRTVAVMGTGIRRIYPKENEGLAREIVEKGGALVSQFWPDSPPATYSFPRRNVTMSGMGQGTVVIEASSTSGAKMQARLAVQHGKKVFLIAQLVTDQTWAKKYVERGDAIDVRDIRDVISALRSPETIRAKTQQRRRLQLELEMA
jgi:DNA processing protein